MKILALSWHPGKIAELTAGGYRRFYEIAKRCPYELVIIDRYPSLYKSMAGPKIKIVEYGKNLLSGFQLLPPLINKLVERGLVVVGILLVMIANRKGTAVVYVPYSEHVELTLPAVIFKFLFKTPLIFCNLNVNIYFLERPLNVFLHKFADKIITISQSLKKDLAKAGIKANFINGVGFNLPKISTTKTQKKYDAIFVGRHTPQKGIFDLIDIWNLLINKYDKRFKLVTVGNIPQNFKDEINKKINNFGLKENIQIFAETQEDEKNELIKSSRIMVFPSHYEGWGIVPMEALSFGLPVIAYNLSVYKESIGKTEALRVVEIGDCDGFAKTVIDTFNNLDTYSALAKKWKPKLSWEEVAKKEWQIIHQD